jgi:uncharacterized membrane protein YdjX (TVP38/TMEM64 family)
MTRFVLLRRTVSPYAGFSQVRTMTEVPRSPLAESRRVRLYWVIGIAASIVVATALAVWGTDLWRLLNDERAIEALVEQAGVWGPLVLILINAAQVVIAPVPGYVVQLAAGYLYGPLWGGIYSGIGLLLGGMVAMFMGRTLGRPFVRRLVGPSRMDRWETVTHTDKVAIWFFLLLGPLGDAPFLLAGLSRVSYLAILLLTLFVRVPSVFLSTAVGSGVIPIVWLGLIALIATVMIVILIRYQARIEDGFMCVVRRQSGATLPILSEIAPVNPECEAHDAPPS